METSASSGRTKRLFHRKCIATIDAIEHVLNVANSYLAYRVKGKVYAHAQVPQFPHADVPVAGAVQLRGAGRQRRAVRRRGPGRLRYLHLVHQVRQALGCELPYLTYHIQRVWYIPYQAETYPC
jgi:hypothetical protein